MKVFVSLLLLTVLGTHFEQATAPLPVDPENFHPIDAVVFSGYTVLYETWGDFVVGPQEIATNHTVYPGPGTFDQKLGWAFLTPAPDHLSEESVRWWAFDPLEGAETDVYCREITITGLSSVAIAAWSFPEGISSEEVLRLESLPQDLYMSLVLRGAHSGATTASFVVRGARLSEIPFGNLLFIEAYGTEYDIQATPCQDRSGNDASPTLDFLKTPSAPLVDLFGPDTCSTRFMTSDDAFFDQPYRVEALIEANYNLGVPPTCVDWNPAPHPNNNLNEHWSDSLCHNTHHYQTEICKDTPFIHAFSPTSPWADYQVSFFDTTFVREYTQQFGIKTVNIDTSCEHIRSTNTYEFCRMKNHSAHDGITKYRDTKENHPVKREHSNLFEGQDHFHKKRKLSPDAKAEIKRNEERKDSLPYESRCLRSSEDCIDEYMKKGGYWGPCEECPKGYNKYEQGCVELKIQFETYREYYPAEGASALANYDFYQFYTLETANGNLVDRGYIRADPGSSLRGTSNLKSMNLEFQVSNGHYRLTIITADVSADGCASDNAPFTDVGIIFGSWGGQWTLLKNGCVDVIEFSQPSYGAETWGTSMLPSSPSPSRALFAN